MKENDFSYLGIYMEKTRRKLYVRLFLSFLLPAVSIAGICGCLVLLISLFTPVYYAYLYVLLIWAAGVFTAACFAMLHQPTEKETALYIDSFGLQERVTTALENRDAADEISMLQREDAAQMLKEKESLIRIKYIGNTAMLWVFCAILLLQIGLFFVPSPAKEQAVDRHEAQMIRRESEKKISNAEEALDEAMTAKLSEEQKKSLAEMKKALSDSKTALPKQKTREAAEKEKDKLDFKLREMSSLLAVMAKQDAGGNAGALSEASDQIAGSVPDQPSDELADAGKGENGQQGEEQKEAATAQQEGEDEPKNGQNEDGKSDPDETKNPGESPGEAIAPKGNEESGKNQQSGAQQDEGQDADKSDAGGDDQKGQPEQKSGETTSGDNDGQPAEGNDGSGNGAADAGPNAGNNENAAPNGQQESGKGNGGGAGGQSDVGTGTNGHDYVSIPGREGMDENLLGQIGEGESESYRSQNGLTWQGEHVDGSAVIGEYRQKAVEGLSQGRYPPGMTDVIKNYFDGF